MSNSRLQKVTTEIDMLELMGLNVIVDYVNELIATGGDRQFGDHLDKSGEFSASAVFEGILWVEKLNKEMMELVPTKDSK